MLAITDLDGAIVFLTWKWRINKPKYKTNVRYFFEELGLL